MLSSKNNSKKETFTSGNTSNNVFYDKISNTSTGNFNTMTVRYEKTSFFKRRFNWLKILKFWN